MNIKRFSEASKQNEQRKIKALQIAAAVLFWSALIILCIIYKDEITVERIVSYTPKNLFSAAAVMLCLFALKSVVFIIYGSILYAVNGVLFPLPIAVIMNIAGSAVMTTIPFLIGKKLGCNTLESLIQKHPKLILLKELPNENQVFISFFVRMVGLLPGDLVGMYLGASGIRYGRYILGTLLGLLPAAITFSVMGNSMNDVSSPEFIISASAEIGLIALSIILNALWQKHKKKSKSTECDTKTEGK